MNYQIEAKKLIEDLHAFPDRFTLQGKAYQLLQCYFHGVDLESLRPLLMSEVALVRRAAAFVVSELGLSSQKLIQTTALLIHDPDPHIQWCVLESLMLCSHGENVKNFVFVLAALESQKDAIRQLTMRLISRATLEQLEGVSNYCSVLGTNASIHAKGLKGLLEGKYDDLACFLKDRNSLLNRYGAIGAKRFCDQFPSLFKQASTSEILEVQKFIENK